MMGLLRAGPTVPRAITSLLSGRGIRFNRDRRRTGGGSAMYSRARDPPSLFAGKEFRSVARDRSYTP